MRNQVTVVPSDHLVIVDGEAITIDPSDLEQVPLKGIHAIHWNGNSGIVEYIGEIPNQEVIYETHVIPYLEIWETYKHRPMVKDVSEYKKEKLIQLNLSFSESKMSGYTTLEDGTKINGRNTDLENINTLISQANKGTLTFPFPFRTYDNHNKAIDDLNGLIAIQTAIENRGLELYQYKWQLEQKINNCSTVEDIDKIDVTIGWPGTV